ncbi:hypothetical protein ABE237_25335 [Brevibacillus formosus]|uniref:hypothetical protein n=1 Tax=Brevibacillus formosus TaxID=54913 RepID=UPI0018CC80A9|nr:hypothetical protein [Brevibacillus formosus]MBG9940564.1 hypothetical protein [Brevibacillus formosus]
MSQVVEVFTDDFSTIAFQVLCLFKHYKVPHVERNIIRNPEALKDFKRLKLTLIPSFFIGGYRHDGYQAEVWVKLLKHNYDIHVSLPEMQVLLPVQRFWDEEVSEITKPIVFNY